MEKLEYKELNLDGERWNKESRRIIRDLLEVWDYGHRIIICHPNCIFANKPVSKVIKDFDNIDWQLLSEDFSFNEDNSFTNIYPGCNSAFAYVYKRFKHELFNSKKVQGPRHLAVLELDDMGGKLVRGIFKATKEGLFAAENPLFTEYKSKSLFDKSLRFSDDNVRNLSEFVQAKEK